MSKVGDNISAGNSRWTFGGNVHENFDGHVGKSVPLYAEGHSLIENLSDFFLPSGSLVYDLGCSTGTLLHRLAERHKGQDIQFIGCDPEDGMVKTAKQRCADFPNVAIRCENAVEMDFEKSNLITSYYTIQFIHPSIRQTLFNKIYESLNWGGAFVLFEKVRAPDARFQDIMTQIYSEYKITQGYSSEEIMAKARSLKGVLEPFSTQGNVDMARRAGFQDVMTIFKYACFEGFLAIK